MTFLKSCFELSAGIVLLSVATWTVGMVVGRLYGEYYEWRREHRKLS